MPEIPAAELRKLRTLEKRVVTVNENLGEIREKRKELQSSLTATRRELREAQRGETAAAKQISELIAENARIAAELDATRSDLAAVTEEASKLRAGNGELESSLASSKAEAKAAAAAAKKATRSQERLEQQLRAANEKLDGTDPPEVTPDQLSELLGGFIDKVGGRTGLDLHGTKINLRVGFSGRGGGAFVVPSLGVDPSKLPELHDVQFDLSRRPSDG